MGKGEGDDLGGVGRIGEDLLVAGHRCVEANFAAGFALGAQALAKENRAIGEHESAGGEGLSRFVQNGSQIGAVGLSVKIAPRMWA